MDNGQVILHHANGNPVRSADKTAYEANVDAFLRYGYAEAQSVAFFASKHVDPLDLENETGLTRISLEPIWRKGRPGRQVFGKWQKAKGVWIHDAIQYLVAQLSKYGRPIWLPVSP